MLLRGYNSQRAISDRYPMPVDVTADTSKLTSITGEVVQFQYFENSYITCGATGTTNAATWAALTDTSTFEISLNGKSYRITPDFTGVASMADVATAIETALQARLAGATCVYSTDRFVITTDAVRNVGNSVSYLTNSSANTGTDITTATWINGIEGNAVITAPYLANDTGKAAGTVVVAKLLYGGILDSIGSMIGTEKDNSLVWTTNTALPKSKIKILSKSVIEDTNNASLFEMVEIATKDFENGEWGLDFRQGLIMGVKATTGTNDTAAYKLQTSETSGGGGLTGDVDIKKVGGVDVSAKDAAYAEPPLGMGLEYEALGALTTDGSAAGDKVPVKGTATGIQYVIHTNGTQSMPTMDVNTRAGFVKLTDGTNEPSVGDGTIKGLNTVMTDGENKALIVADTADGIANAGFKGINVISRLQGYNGTTWDRIKSSSGALDVNVASGTITADLDGEYDAGTNPNPDTTGLIFHSNIVAPDKTNLNVRTTGGVSVANVASDTFFGNDTRAKLYAKDTGTANDTEISVKAGNTYAVDDKVIGVADANVKADTGSIKTNTDTPTTLTGGEKTVAASGTAEALGASLATKNIYIRAKKTNTGDVYVGDVNVDAVTSQQIVLSSGEAVTLSISNRATVYLDVDTNGEGVDYVCMS